jgi:hypothetical protein
MKLGTRLLLGYWYLVGLLVVFATVAALALLSLGRSIGTVLDENSESVRASMSMLDALEQERSALLSWLLGDAGAQSALGTSDSRSGRPAARDNITAPGRWRSSPASRADTPSTCRL